MQGPYLRACVCPAYGYCTPCQVQKLDMEYSQSPKFVSTSMTSAHRLNWHLLKWMFNVRAAALTAKTYGVCAVNALRRRDGVVIPTGNDGLGGRDCPVKVSGNFINFYPRKKPNFYAVQRHHPSPGDLPLGTLAPKWIEVT